MLQRILVAGVTVAVLLWVGVLLRDQRLGNPAADRLVQHPGLTAAQVAADADSVRGARWLDPDPTWDLKLATGLLVQGRPGASLAVALPAARREPANLDLWNIVAQAGTKAEPAAVRLARAEILRHNSPALRRR
jgi:predicted Zn-dependent protease